MRDADVFEHVRTEGGLLPSDLLERVRAMDTELPGMSAATYGLGSSRRLREVLSEEVAEAWSEAQEAWRRFRGEVEELVEDERGTTETRERFLLPLLELLGFEEVATRTAVEIDGVSFPVSHGIDHVPVHLLSYRVELDRRTEGVAGAARRAPHRMLQEFLNRSDDHLWAILSNGLRLRVLRDNASLTRPAFVEFDLEGMFEGSGYPSFALMWLVCHRSRFAGERPELCLLEEWVRVAQTEGTRALDQLRDGVEAALTTLGTGLLSHPANRVLRSRLESGELSKQELYRQLLRLVYRMLFLFVAEDRDLLLLPEERCKPDARDRYTEYYSTARLRNLARRRVGTRHDDLWRQLQVVMWGIGADEGLGALALPPLGGLLWRPEGMVETVGIDGDEDTPPTHLRNDVLLEAVRHLAFVRQGRQVRRVDYRNLGSEELGSVYESLLELHPEVSVADQRFGLTSGAGNERKTTGSYYTPTSLIDQLLDTALEPLLDRAEETDDPEAALLELTVCDPAMGSGHFLVAAAHRISNRLSVHYEEHDEPDDPKRNRPRDEAMRDVVSHCIYGVDVNPMATELAKVSLWLEAHVPGKPLTFLDHHLRTGNSLLGTTPALIARGIPDGAFQNLEGDDRKACNANRKRNRELRRGQQSLLAAEAVGDYDLLSGMADELADLPDHDVEALHRKEERHRELESSEQLRRARVTADAWCAAFTAPKHEGDNQMQPYELFYELRDGQPSPTSPAYETIGKQASSFDFFHWHLEFPHLFQPVDEPQEDDPTGWTGGFDVMLGNPPWEVLQMVEQEWFATKDEEIAKAPKASVRKKLIKKLENEPGGSTRRPLADEWLAAVRHSEAERNFVRESSRYPLTAVGKLNTYAMFVDLFQSTISDRGRLGVVCPTGIATGFTYQDFFGKLVLERRIDSFYTFENEEKLFPDVHNQFKYGLLTLTGVDDRSESMSFTGYVRSADEIRDDNRRYELTPQEVRAINPNTITAPIFRHSRDAAVTARIHRTVPVLVEEAAEGGDPWSADFLQMFNMASDSGHFVTKDEAERAGGKLVGTVFEMPDGGRLVPLYEGKMIWHYDHRYGTYEGQTQKQANKGVIPHVSDERHADPDFSILFRYWVPQDLAAESLEGRWDRDWLFGWRDVGPSERTLVPSLIPRVAAGDKLPLLLPDATTDEVLLLAASLSALVTDYATRQKTSSAVKQFVVRQIPVPSPQRVHEDLPWGHGMVGGFVIDRVIELSVTDVELVPLLSELGRPPRPFRWQPARRVILQAELDGLFFHLYGLDRDQTEWVLDTFTVLEKYEQRDHGEFRTKRLVLERYDAMARAIESGEPYATPLDPPPADPSLQVDV